MTNLQTNLSGISLKNPLILASGVLGTSASLMERCARHGIGAITAKSCGPEARKGHDNPVALAWSDGVINAIGLTNPGAQEEASLLNVTQKALLPYGVPLFASIFAPTLQQFAEVTRIMQETEVDLIEVNISCPNVASEFGLPFSADAASAAAVTKIVRENTRKPISIKLAPNVPNISLIARAVVEAGADAITAINTMPAMLIDPTTGKPVLSNRTGGLSGPAIKPIALRCVFEIAEKVSVPIIGTGGITTGLDAAEMIMAGATVIGIGSAFWYHGISAVTQILTELQQFMAEHNFTDLDSMRGMAHR